MIIKIKEQLYNRDGKLRWTHDVDVELKCTWHGAQNYFNETHLKDILDEKGDLGAVVLKWDNKIYEFKRNKNDD